KAAYQSEEVQTWDWSRTLVHTADFFAENLSQMSEMYAVRRLKQYLKMLGQSHPEAKELFENVKRLHDPTEISPWLSEVRPLGPKKLSDHLQNSTPIPEISL
ncbi:MAG: hypothetical protein AAF202_07110, partial [Pseudomonadota bacterium]